MYGFMFTAHTPLLSVYSSKRKMLDFSALLSKVLYTFAFVDFWVNYDRRVVFYVGFHNFRKNQH